MGGKNLYKLFIDTGGFIALVDERDSYHQEARREEHFFNN